MKLFKVLTNENPNLKIGDILVSTPKTKLFCVYYINGDEENCIIIYNIKNTSLYQRLDELPVEKEKEKDFDFTYKYNPNIKGNWDRKKLNDLADIIIRDISERYTETNNVISVETKHLLFKNLLIVFAKEYHERKIETTYKVKYKLGVAMTPPKFNPNLCYQTRPSPNHFACPLGRG